MKARELAGVVFGRLTVVARDGSIGQQSAWRCKCECGQEIRTKGFYLTNGDTKSCGCAKIKHHMLDTPTYKSWRAMLTRCENENHVAFHRYGGRGIAVCPEWHDFRSFLHDMGQRPAGRTLDRIDNDAGYHAANCKWSTPAEQARNRSSTKVAA